ncbi:hypothetical protein HaLaN_27699, partial [Haematococcus lacustris]
MAYMVGYRGTHQQGHSPCLPATHFSLFLRQLAIGQLAIVHARTLFTEYALLSLLSLVVHCQTGVIPSKPLWVMLADEFRTTAASAIMADWRNKDAGWAGGNHGDPKQRHL